MNQELKKWLKQPDYATGVKLYEQIGENTHLKHQFVHGRPQNMMPYLVAEMKRLAAKMALQPGPPPQPKTRAATSQQPKPAKEAPKRNKNLTNEQQEVEAFRKDKFVEMARLRNSLVDMASDQDRLVAMEEIERLEGVNKWLWEELDYYEQNGEWKTGTNPLQRLAQEQEEEAAAPPAPTSADELRAERKRLKDRLRRAELALERLALQEGKESGKYLKKEKAAAEIQDSITAIEQKLEKI